MPSIYNIILKICACINFIFIVIFKKYTLIQISFWILWKNIPSYKFHFKYYFSNIPSYKFHLEKNPLLYEPHTFFGQERPFNRWSDIVYFLNLWPTSFTWYMPLLSLCWDMEHHKPTANLLLYDALGLPFSHFTWTN